MTPAHLTERVAGYSDELTAQYRRTLYGAWNAAALHRVEAKKFPSLERLMAPPVRQSAPQGVDEAALKQAFQRHNDRVKRENGEAR